MNESSTHACLPGAGSGCGQFGQLRRTLQRNVHFNGPFGRPPHAPARVVPTALEVLADGASPLPGLPANDLGEFVSPRERRGAQLGLFLGALLRRERAVPTGLSAVRVFRMNPEPVLRHVPLLGASRRLRNDMGTFYPVRMGRGSSKRVNFK